MGKGKGKLIAGIIILVIGVGMVPGGIGMDRLIDRRMDESITVAFQLIRTDALGDSTENTRDMVLTESTPEVLLEIKDEVVNYIARVVNGSSIAGYFDHILTTMDDNDTIDFNTAMDLFFSDVDFTTTSVEAGEGPYELLGISEYIGMDLGLEYEAQDAIMTLLTYNQSTGVGLFQFLDQYQNAIPNVTLQDSMETRYHCYWYQLEEIGKYIIDYAFFQVMIIEDYPAHMSADFAEEFFYKQWANRTIVDGNMAMYFNDNTLEIIRWEYSQELNLSTAEALWNVTNPLAPLNEEGVFIWEDSELNVTLQLAIQAEFGLSSLDYTRIRKYLFSYSMRVDIINPLKSFFANRTIDTLAIDKFYDHWATGTVLSNTTANLYNDLYEGFELVTPPDTSGLTTDMVWNLWTANNLTSMRNLTGSRIWLNLAREPIATRHLSDTYVELRDDYYLNNAQMDLLLDWVLNFREMSIFIQAEAEGLPYTPYEMKVLVKNGAYITGGIVGFIGLMLLLGALKKKKR